MAEHKKIDNSYIQTCVTEFFGTYGDEATDEALLLEKAFFVEDVFKVSLTDDEIIQENLGEAAAIENFIAQKLGI